MGIGQSSTIVTNGLIFNYDMYNTKSYKGPPLRNHIQTISPNTGSGTGYVLTGGTEIVNIPTLGEVTSTYCNLQNTGASWCCVNIMNYGNAGNIFSGSTLYTYLILYRSDSGYTNGNWMYRYEYNSSGTYQTESGVHTTGNRTYLGNGWYYAWGTFTTQAATTNLTCYSFSYNYSSFNDKISVAKVCILPGNYSGLHPRYWPDTNTTRNNTQAIYDLTGNNTITANSLTYNSDGSFSFNGSNYATISQPLSGGVSTPFTLMAWAKSSTLSGWQTVLGTHGTYRQIGFNGSNFYWGGNGGGGNSFVNGGSGLSTNTWYHLAFTFDGSTGYGYLNGVQTTGSIGSNGGTIGVNMLSAYQSSGGEYLNGSIGTASIYNRALTSQEVLQNFNAQRGLYGI